MTPQQYALHLYNEMLFRQYNTPGAARRATDCAILLVKEALHVIEQHREPNEIEWVFYNDVLKELEASQNEPQANREAQAKKIKYNETELNSSTSPQLLPMQCYAGRQAEPLALLRELVMRGQFAFPETEADLDWFDEGIKPELFIAISQVLQLGKVDANGA